MREIQPNVGAYDYIVTPFPEALGKLLNKNNPYLLWIIISFFLLVFRISAMLLCGEEFGRYAINIVYALLPGTLAILIIIYSKSAENMTGVFCKIITHDDTKVEGWCEKYIRRAFSDLGMISCGILFILAFGPMLKDNQIYPTPEHNRNHRKILRDRIMMNVGKTWGQTNADANNATMGWVQLPLGKVIKLAKDNNDTEFLDLLTKAPQEDYITPLPEPNDDEKSETASNTQEAKKAPTHKRGESLIWPLRYIYTLLEYNETRWEFSEITFNAVMFPLLFMSGAILWCLGGIIWITRDMGKRNEVRQALKVDTFPHPLDSIRSVGRTLWFVAMTHGIIYTIVMVCMFFARPDTFALTVACLFSLVVVVIFIAPQYNLHKLMVRAKYAKIAPLDEHLDQALRQAQTTPSTENIQHAKNILELQSTLAQACEWPCDLKGLVTILGSVLIPLLMAGFSLYDHFQ